MSDSPPSDSPRKPWQRLPKPVRLALPVLVLAVVGLLVYHTSLAGARNLGGIVASGLIEARTTELAPEVAGTVIERPIDKGQTLKTGQLVALVASEVSAAQWKQAQAAVQAAQDKLQQAEEAVALQTGVSAAQVGKALAAEETARSRYGDIAAGSRPQEIETARAAVRQALAARAAAQAQLRQLLAGSRPQEIRAASANYEAAVAQTAAARAQLADLQAGSREEELRQAQAQVNAAEAAANRARRDYERARGLIAQGAISPQQLDAAQASTDASAADLKAARERLALLQAGSRKDQIAAAKANLDRVVAAQQAAREALSLTREGPRREDIDRARAAVRQAEAVYDSAQAQLSLALAGPRAGQRSIARSQISEAAAALREAEANRRQVALRLAEARAARSQWRQALAQLEAARASLDKYRVLAPSPGVIDDTHVRVGEVVKPGSSLATLVDYSDTWVTVYVPEPLLSKVSLGARAVVTVDGQPGRKFTGVVRRIAAQAEFTPKYVQTKDERARTVFAVEIALPNRAGLLKPGMPADAVIEASGSK